MRGLFGISGLTCAFLLACTCFAVSPPLAFAYVSDKDIVAGETVAERALAAENAIDIEAPYACMIDNYGNIYFERGAHVPQKIASMTKIMTAILALEHSTPDEVVTVTWEATRAKGSSAYLHAGDKLTMEALLHCLIVPSGNDAAMAIAIHIGEKALAGGWDLGLPAGTARPTDPYKAFICLMNKKAAELGMVDTLFTNPHGLDDGIWTANHHSTPYDVALMAKYAMTFDLFRSIAKLRSADVQIQRDGGVITKHLSNSTWYLSTYANATGVKTGWTDLAGLCFAGSAKEGELELYAVVTLSTANQRFYDVRAMHVWGFEHIIAYDIGDSPETVSVFIDGETVEKPIFAELAHPAWGNRLIKTYLDGDVERVWLLDFDGDVTQEVTLEEPEGPVNAGQVVGKVVYLQGGRPIGERNIIAAESCRVPDAFDILHLTFDKMKDEMKGTYSAVATTVLSEPVLVYDAA